MIQESAMKPAPKRILVADDEPAIRSMLSHFLTRNGYEVITAPDGVEACEAAESHRPDLVLLDLMLPRRDGYTVLFHLRSRPTTRATPVVFVSGEPSAHEDIARSLGAQGFLAKPFRSADLIARVEAALATAGRAA
jgi:CheY-like chemotaxis protein